MTRHTNPDALALIAEGVLRHRMAARIGSRLARSSRSTRVHQARGDQQHSVGDPDAFGELFGRHRDRLRAVAVRTLSDPEEAADALQDAMIAALRRADSFRGDSAVTTWLHRIVVNASGPHAPPGSAPDHSQIGRAHV